MLALFGRATGAAIPIPTIRAMMFAWRQRWTSAKLRLGAHPFGTDRLGRDVYSRVILGANSIFRIAGLGTLDQRHLPARRWGLFMGYRGGWVDESHWAASSMLCWRYRRLLLALVLVGIIRNLDFLPRQLASRRWRIMSCCWSSPRSTSPSSLASPAAPRSISKRGNLWRRRKSAAKAKLLHHLPRNPAVGHPLA